MKILTLALCLFAGNAFADTIRELKSIDCSFQNSLTVRGERNSPQYSDIAVETTMGFSSQTMRASLNASNEIEIQGPPAAFDPTGSGGAKYYFKGNIDKDSDEVQTVRGILSGWAGKTAGTCEIQLMTGELRL